MVMRAGVAGLLGAMAGSAVPWYRARGNDPLLCIRSWLVALFFICCC